MFSTKITKICIISLVGLLILSSYSVNPTHAARDETDPIFYGIYLSHGNITNGETVKVYINATDSQSGIENIVFCLVNSLDNCIHEGHMDWNGSSGFWEVEVTINQYWNGIYTIEHIKVLQVLL